MSKRKAIWLLAGGLMQLPAARYIIKQGYHLILSDRDPKCAVRKAYGSKLTFIAADTFDYANNIKQFTGMGLANDYTVVAVLTVGADCHLTVNRIAKYFDIPTTPTSLHEICADKALTRRQLTGTGLLQPKYTVANCVKDIRKWLDANTDIDNYVIKPRSSSGTRGFSKLRRSDADKVVTKALVLAQANNAHAPKPKDVIIEACLVPVEREIAEMSIEVLCYQNHIYWLNWVDRIYGRDLLRNDTPLSDAVLYTKFYNNVKPGVEIGHISPAIHNDATFNVVYHMCAKAVRAVELQRSVVPFIMKFDIMLTDDGPVILEMTPRLSGGFDSALSSRLRGGRYIEGVIDLLHPQYAWGTELTAAAFNRYFKLPYPNKFVTVLTKLPKDTINCIGRQFVVGEAYDRNTSISNAITALHAGQYIDEEVILNVE